MQSHKEAILASAQTTLLTIGGVQLGILEPALCKALELTEMDTTESCSHKDVRHCKISQSVEATGKVVKAIQISSIHSMCMTTTICIASHLVPLQPRTLRKICYQSVKWGKRPSSHSSRSCWYIYIYIYKNQILRIKKHRNLGYW